MKPSSRQVRRFFNLIATFYTKVYVLKFAKWPVGAGNLELPYSSKKRRPGKWSTLNRWLFICDREAGLVVLWRCQFVENRDGHGSGRSRRDLLRIV